MLQYFSIRSLAIRYSIAIFDIRAERVCQGMDVDVDVQWFNRRGPGLYPRLITL